MIQIGAIASENTNLTLGKNDASGAIDHSYSRFGKREGADVASETMSFDDFIDMINPLQHIPVISSVYRAIVGENINPVSRIAGDALYGGAMGLGLASAGLSALGAISDEIVIASNEGQSASGSVVASLFGQDDAPNTQVAAAVPDATTETSAQEMPKASFLQTPALQSPILQMPDFSAGTTQIAAATPADSGATTTALADNGIAKGIPLDRTKMPYSGTMDSSMLASAQQTQTLAAAMAGKRDVMQAQRALRNSRFETTAASPTAAPVTSVATQPAPETQAAMQNLIKELQAVKSVNQYKNAAQSTPIPGNTVNVIN